MYTQEVQLSTRDRQFGKTSECAHKMSNSRERQFGKTSECAHKRSKSQHEIGIWKDFIMCTQVVQFSTRGKQFGKTSEYAHKRSNSQHGIGDSARHPNVHTRCPTLNTAKAVLQDFLMCTQEVQL
ncbi:hypothetical protein PoB_004572400 [Plakobranchus ocellatus]|uniref:Uncharacterized protein n=1 Tax=Plakobranchus ocellatus TaxID=259542 RepID=A0AAV4BGK1_9GAST|nr:hypothetical protein PoB_004572400 [Plakobranchus ocellatus]